MGSRPACRGRLPSAPPELSSGPIPVTCLCHSPSRGGRWLCHSSWMVALNPLLCFRARGHLLPGRSADLWSPRGGLFTCESGRGHSQGPEKATVSSSPHWLSMTRQPEGRVFPRGAGTFINDKGAEMGWCQPRCVSCLLVLPDMLTPAPSAAQARHTVGAQDPGPGDSGVYTVSCIAAFHHVKLTRKTLPLQWLRAAQFLPQTWALGPLLGFPGLREVGPQSQPPCLASAPPTSPHP